MKIYEVINNSTQQRGITACYELAFLMLSHWKEQGHDAHAYEGELKTQGQNFHSWAKDWKEIEMPF